MGNIGQLVTAGQLLEDSSLPEHCELIRGEIVPMSPTKWPHGRITARLHLKVGQFVEAHGLGETSIAETGFHIEHDPDTVRCPDVGFVRASRLTGPEEPGFFQGPPDLAIEVVSPSDRMKHVLAKAQNWLDTGCELVWVVDPKKQTVIVLARGAKPETLAVGDHLAGGEVLPGFDVPVAEIFAR